MCRQSIKMLENQTSQRKHKMTDSIKTFPNYDFRFLLYLLYIYIYNAVSPPKNYFYKAYN